MSFIKELKKPFNLVSFLLTIFSIALSFVFYYQAEKEKEISYNILESNSIIYDNNKTSSLKIYDSNNTLINNNVYLVSGSIWNSGDYSILRDDIRVPLIISLDRGNKIIDFRILKEKDKSVAKFKLIKISDNSLKVNWKYFDPKYGFKFQIIYQNNKESNVKVNAKILNLEEVKKVEQKEKPSLLILVFQILFFSFLIFINYVSFRNKEKEFDYVTAFIILLLLSVIIFAIWKYFNAINLYIFK